MSTRPRNTTRNEPAEACRHQAGHLFLSPVHAVAFATGNGGRGAAEVAGDARGGFAALRSDHSRTLRYGYFRGLGAAAGAIASGGPAEVGAHDIRRCGPVDVS